MSRRSERGHARPFSRPRPCFEPARESSASGTGCVILFLLKKTPAGAGLNFLIRTVLTRTILTRTVDARR